jgi:hypothetical protein
MLTHTGSDLRGCRHWRCRLAIWLLDTVIRLSSRLANSHGLWLLRQDRVVVLLPPATNGLFGEARGVQEMKN